MSSYMMHQGTHTIAHTGSKMLPRMQLEAMHRGPCNKAQSVEMDQRTCHPRLPAAGPCCMAMKLEQNEERGLKGQAQCQRKMHTRNAPLQVKDSITKGRLLRSNGHE